MTEKIIDKLRKMFAHEKSAREIGNIAEAEAFATRAQEILFKHKLEMNDIEFAEQEANEPVLDEYLTTEELTGVSQTARRKSSWVGILIMAVAQANNCEVVASSSRNAYHLVGRESDREAAKQVFKYLYDACIEVAAVKTKEYKMSENYRLRMDAYLESSAVVLRTFASGFKLGFASAISDRLAAERKQLKAAANSETAIVRLNQIELAVKSKVKELFPRIYTTSTSGAKSAAGFYAGKAYGSSIGINSTKRLT